ncbi:MAG TPA: rhomboid family intramembrane serine protease [Pirellulales bacterium]|nr:rhomboid family intramembrane serine protease [Pirellulales bacterium]
MLVPWNTDAPIYHLPWATGGVMLINTVVFIAIASGALPAEDAAPWILVYGDGLHPLQWITSNFLHAGFLHLLGNMVFLWAFGLVVEGKLGWWRFLAVYLGIGVLQCGLEQACMLGAEEGGSLGASAIIYGVMAMALVWAPKNELSCILILGFRYFTFDISILVLAVIYLLIEIVTTVVDNFGWGSSVLHLSGAAIGFGLGTLLLKLQWVDCEGWDLYAVLAGREGEKAKKRKKKKPKTDDQRTPGPSVNQEAALAEIRRLIDDGHTRGAFALHKKMSRTAAGWQLSEPDSRSLITKLLEAEAWPESIELMVGHLAAFPDATRVRLRLAQVLVQKERRPAQALRVQTKLPEGSLPASLEPTRKKLIAEATKLREQVPMELSCEDW